MKWKVNGLHLEIYLFANNKCMFAYVKGCNTATSNPSNAWTTFSLSDQILWHWLLLLGNIHSSSEFRVSPLKSVHWNAAEDKQSLSWPSSDCLLEKRHIHTSWEEAYFQWLHSSTVSFHMNNNSGSVVKSIPTVLQLACFLFVCLRKCKTACRTNHLHQFHHLCFVSLLKWSMICTLSVLLFLIPV